MAGERVQVMRKRIQLGACRTGSSVGQVAQGKCSNKKSWQDALHGVSGGYRHGREFAQPSLNGS
jgi:hypothetical protein